MVEFMGKRLKNPLIASSCIATEKAETILRLAENGVQGAILKSCTNYIRRDTCGKRQFAFDSETGYTYASSPFEKEILTLEECLGLMESLRPVTDILLIPSFTSTGLAIDEWLSACRSLELSGADGIQLDFFYMGNLLGTPSFSEKITELLAELCKSVKIPIMPKLNVNLPKDFIIPILAQAGVEYVSLLDSVRSPFFERTDGGFCLGDRLDPDTTSCFGGWQLPLTLGYTYTAAKAGLKVCAGGGVCCADDVLKLISAGALTVQSATLLTKKPSMAGELV